MTLSATLIVVILFCFIFIIYPYLIYPVLLKIIDVFKSGKSINKVQKNNYERTYVVCVYNGERFVDDKIRNIIKIESGSDDFEVLIVSDASTDNTDALVNRYQQPNIKLIRCPYRMGKANAENYILDYINGELVIFTDITTLFSDDCLKYLLPHFDNTKVGCVSTEDKIISSKDHDEKSEEGIYVRFEMFLRKIESELGILSGVSGSGYICRKELAVEIDAKLTRDLYVPLIAREKGFVTVSEPNAHCYIQAQNDIRSEFNRKIRTFTGGIDTVLSLRQVLNPFKYGLFSFGLISHKLLRWLAPLFMLTMLICSGVLSIYSKYWFMFFIIQILFYVFCLYYYKYPEKKYNKLLGLAFFFTMTCTAAFLAWVNVFTGKHYVTWEPTKRD